MHCYYGSHEMKGSEFYVYDDDTWDTCISDLQMLVAKIPDQSTLCASLCGNLIVPRTRRQISDRVFSVAAPRASNRLPTELKLLRSTDSFRRDLKTLLCDSVYGHQDMD